MVSRRAKKLLKKHGSCLAIAEAYILGEIEPSEECYVLKLVNEVTLEAARIRLDALGGLNSDSIKPVRK